MGTRSGRLFAAAFRIKQCRHLIARTSRSRVWLLSFTHNRRLSLRTDARAPADGREWTPRISKPAMPRPGKSISRAQVAAAIVTRRPEILQALLRGTKGW